MDASTTECESAAANGSEIVNERSCWKTEELHCNYALSYQQIADLREAEPVLLGFILRLFDLRLRFGLAAP